VSVAPGFRIVIPARYGSTRLPGKVLLPLAGKTMLQWVYERARASAAHEVLIATDDERIVTAAQRFGATALMTAPTHASGTDRIAELARRQRWPADDIVVNVQADEPLLPPRLIDQVAGELAATRADIATLATPIESREEFLDPNVVKVVCDAAGFALYFSRAPIPWEREAAAATSSGQESPRDRRRHRGLYAYRVAALARLAQLKPTPLESCEKLEQLRALEHGLRIRVGEAAERFGPDVNTLADLERVAALIVR
jgi:3-deoxy-manno-octulosonate cytidylyltransferase (CMP-KDO synthetase)